MDEDVAERYREFRAFLSQMKEDLEEESERDKISSHYGISDGDFCQMIGDCVGLMLNNKMKKSDAIDKLFPRMNEVERCRVEAYAVARKILTDN